MILPLILLPIIIFLMTSMYLERSEYCAFGLRHIIGSSSFSLLNILIVTMFITVVGLIFYYGYIL